MKISRRKFVQLGSITLAGVPLSGLTANAAWYDPAAAESDELYTAFKDPQGTAKPFVRWWWNGLRVVKEELIRELDMLKALGIGGVEINSIRFPETADPLHYQETEWLSDTWIDLLDFTLKAAKERGMICDIIMGSGWPFGGEFLTKDEQTQMLALGTRNVTGPMVLKVTKAELVKSVDPPISSKHTNVYKELSFMRLAPAALNSLGTVVDLDQDIAAAEFTINIPEGNHVLYYLVKMTGFMAVMFGAPGAAGPVLNHYNKSAVEKYINKMSDAINPKLGLIGKRIRSVFTDSLELEGANWCDDMLQEFEKRRNYSLKPYLPFILFKTGRLGRALKEEYGSVPAADFKETLDRVRYDFEITKMELFQERFLDTFLGWCKKNGVLSRVQAYGREYHPSDSSMQIDIPECETWIRSHIGDDLKEFDYDQGRSYSEVNKFVSSGARLSGKKLISCEEITNTQLVFNATLERIKMTGDQSNLSGVTHSILHGFNYSPPDAKFPAWVRYGTFFNERNPWWPFLKNWVTYKARLSAIFQRGTMISEVAVMHPLPDLWSKYAAQWDPFPERAYPEYVHNIWEAIHQNGNGCDYISESVMQKATFPGGKLTFGPRQYKVLLVVEAETIHPNTARAMKRFAEAGGTLVFIGKSPFKAPGYHDHAKYDKEVADTISAINGRSNVSVYPSPKPDDTMINWYKGIQKRYNIEPYMKTDNPHSSVSQVYYQLPGADVFFIANYNATKKLSFTGEFRVSPTKKAWLWNPETGERTLYPSLDKGNKLAITLGPAESKLIVFDHAGSSAKRYEPVAFSAKPGATFSPSWTLHLNHVDGTKKTVILPALADFKDHKDLVAFAGNAVYENSFELTSVNGITMLNLGKVIGVSEVSLNGKKLGTRWYGEHIYPVKGAILQGKNTLLVKLTTTLGNYMYSLTDNKDSIKWIKGKKQPLYSQGVLGPVEVG